MVINMLKKSNQLELSFSKHTELYDILIKPDNFWRQLNVMIDFSFVYEQLKDKYSSFKKFHPSLTAQTTMKFILSNEENHFYSILDNNNETVILNLLQLIMIIINQKNYIA